MIENLIHQLTATLPPSSGLNLQGFTADLEHALRNKPGFFTSAQVKLGPDPSRLIEATALITDEAKSLQDVKQALLDIWRATAYSFFQASSCIWYQEATVLRFVSIISPEEFFVSGVITAQAGPYARLAKEFEQKFHPLPRYPKPGELA